MKNSEDVETWFFGMNKFFRLHSYSKKMKAKITTFNIKGKVDIWWEDVNNFKGIREEELIWDEFGRLFKKKYLFERYYDERAKESYELQMGSVRDDEDISTFLELLRYLSYLKVKKQRFKGLSMGCQQRIDIALSLMSHSRKRKP